MKKIIRAIFFLTTVYLFTGCLKRDGNLDATEFNSVMIVPNSNWPLSNWPVSDSLFTQTTSTAELRLYASVSFEKPLDQEVKVTFRRDSALVMEYNARWRYSYIFMPDSCYEVSSFEVTIPAGSRQAWFPVKLFPNKMNTTTSYMLAFSIGDAAGIPIATNFKSMVFPVMVQ